ncbi:hypothetical protein OVY01_11540 [Robbsia sp. Bb-Pol-6]|uniref:Pilus assembly protein PilP n=1 Tax=Robbsia betulipollinis TaxID=2981849 RepID=A0ABT3ZMX0_9BURK|nr:hypothetical protein [Robbsia betulipollinis]MCY0387856.1 hypothetical protein [Robbsia betulipollinis]
MSNKTAHATLRAMRFALPFALAIGFAPCAGASPADASPADASPADAGATDAQEAVAASESVDAFARRQLEDHPRGAASPGSGLELMFTQAEGKARSAYLLVDGRYGKDVRRGDIVKGWTVRAIDSDAVEIDKDGRREKLLLASEATSHQATASTDRAQTR